MFLDNTDYPFASELEKAFPDIRREFEALAPDDFVAWPERFLCAEGWNVFGLLAFGRRMEENCERCPETVRIAERIPGLTTIGFSVLQPNTEIKPHKGYTGEVYRCHLGLVVPDDCALRVGDETRSWKEGEVMIFDDTVEHEAWNRSDSVRVVLLLDFLKKPDDQDSERVIKALGRQWELLENFI